MTTPLSSRGALKIAVLSACLVAGTAVAHYGSIRVIKYYDANANGIRDAGEPGISGWPMWLQSATHSVSSVRVTYSNGTFTWFSLPAGNDYSITEATPIETNWVQSSPVDGAGNPVNPQTGQVIVKGLTTYVTFGNYCTITTSGGRTPGFWSNRNGEAKMLDEADGAAEELAGLRALNLVDADGVAFDPTTHAQLSAWLRGRSATNMAYQLSAHLAAMWLNVEGRYLSGTAYYEPFDGTINQLMTAANDSLGLDGFTPAGDPERTIQEELKDHLDALNNSGTVPVVLIPSKPCRRTFPTT